MRMKRKLDQSACSDLAQTRPRTAQGEGHATSTSTIAAASIISSDNASSITTASDGIGPLAVANPGDSVASRPSRASRQVRTTVLAVCALLSFFTAVKAGSLPAP